MSSKIYINKTIKPFKKKIKIEGDKSISIRWALLASQAKGRSKAYNLLKSEDVLNTLKCLKKLGVKVNLKKDICTIDGLGLNGFKYKKNIILNSGNSGTLGRLLMGLLVHCNKTIKLIGDKSLSKRDFSRVTIPLSKFGAKIKSNYGKLPVTIKGTDSPRPIIYYEKKGSAQCKSSVMLAALNTKGQTIIKAKNSRNHTELMYKHLKLPIKVFDKKNYQLIKVHGKNEIQPLNYNIPSDISSSAFFMVLTALSKDSEINIANVNVNKSRIGLIKILKMMGIPIMLKNQKNYKGEIIADINVKSCKLIKPIKCPTNLNSSAIDEFLVIFLVAARANGISEFKNLNELNQKESPRLDWGSKILNLIGIKTIIKKGTIKIYGNPNLKVNESIIIKDYLKDHRVFMTCVVAALVFGGKWTIHDKDSIKTSFPSFLKIISDIKK